MIQPSPLLKHLFSSNLRVKVLSYLVLHPAESFHVRGLASAIEEYPATVGRELANLERAGVVTSTMIGNQKHHSLNRESPIYDDLRNIFLKTTGVGEIIRSALERLSGIELAFIYGSFASGEAHAKSDLDLMVIGDIPDKKLAPPIARVERRLSREVNYTLFSRREVEKRLGNEGDFVHEVFAGPKIVLVGKTNDQLLEKPTMQR